VRPFNQIPTQYHNSWRVHFPGKTTFLMFMLIRLIAAHQIVLLCTSASGWLFYQGEVYNRPAISCFNDLPVRKGEGRYSPISTLIDTDSNDRAPSISIGFNIWPIQASSPRPKRYKSWSKQAGAALLGLPLWTMEELDKG